MFSRPIGTFLKFREVKCYFANIRYAYEPTGTVCISDPYYCSQGNMIDALGKCISNPENIIIDELIQATNTFATNGEIDNPSNMYNSRVFVFNGALDSVVHPGWFEVDQNCKRKQANCMFNRLLSNT